MSGKLTNRTQVRSDRDYFCRIPEDKWNNHHLDPKYLGGSPSGETVRISPSYHQVVTNAFREAFPYRTKNAAVRYDSEVVQRFMGELYIELPLKAIPKDWKPPTILK